MNLKTCIECRKKYSDILKKCPNCGYKPEDNKLKNNANSVYNKKRKGRFIVLAAVNIILIIISVFAVNMIITSQEIKELEEEADSLREHGKYETAIVVYNEILRIKETPEINAKILECEIAINTIYFGNLILANDALRASEKICRKICAFTGAVWINTFFNEDEYNKGNYDPNNALSNLYQTQEMQDSISALASTKYEIDLQMKKLQYIPDDYIKLYNEILLLYQKFNVLYDHVTSLNDSYQTYMDKSEDFIDDFEDQYKKVASLIEIGPIDNVSRYVDLTDTNIYTETANLVDIDKKLQELFASYND